jgi:hypothetical protein
MGFNDAPITFSKDALVIALEEEQKKVEALKTVLRWYAGEIDSLPCEDADDGNAWHSNKDVSSIPNVIFDQGKRAIRALKA